MEKEIKLKEFFNSSFLISTEKGEKLYPVILEELEKALSITNSGIEKVKAKRIIERIKQLTISIELISKNRRN